MKKPEHAKTSGHLGFTTRRMSPKEVRGDRSRFRKQFKRETKRLAVQGAEDEEGWQRHRDAMKDLSPVRRKEMARRHLELGLELLQPWTTDRDVVLEHVQPVNRLLCALAKSGAGEAVQSAVNCTRTLMDTLHDLEFEHPGTLAQFPRDDRFFPSKKRKTNYKRAPELVKRFVGEVNQLRQQLTNAAQMHDGWSERENVTLHEYLEKLCGFLPEQIALKDLPALAPETREVWWEQALKPYLGRADTINAIKQTPLWQELAESVRSPKDYKVVDELRRRCKSALKSLSNRRDYQQK